MVLTNMARAPMPPGPVPDRPARLLVTLMGTGTGMGTGMGMGISP